MTRRVAAARPPSVQVVVASPLHSYTGGPRVEGVGATVAELLRDLDRQFPGLRFRVIDEQDCVRAHVRIFVNGRQVFDIAERLRAQDRVHVVQALSGG